MLQVIRTGAAHGALEDQVSQAAATCERLRRELDGLLNRTHGRRVDWGFDHSHGLSQSDWKRVIRLQDELRAVPQELADRIKYFDLVVLAGNGRGESMVAV
jgi:hypothetical protein